MSTKILWPVSVSARSSQKQKKKTGADSIFPQCALAFQEELNSPLNNLNGEKGEADRFFCENVSNCFRLIQKTAWRFI